ncbi:hypothetical protein PanWU01x14_107540 [Parasponia andersonii]|uniref:Uncharacterized protein n=1 Tax=Parasponia andersonii TaxID=3476 RepID=A0A2P5D0D0_PARAD|nr:hypothetical protein PanWU01x14_107540 [Parasponia andersonii]
MKQGKGFLFQLPAQILEVPARLEQTKGINKFSGLKLAAAIGTPRAVKVTSHRPPRRRKNCTGPSSPHEYKVPSFRDEYSFTCYSNTLLICIYRERWRDGEMKHITYRPLLERNLNFQARFPIPARESACFSPGLIFQGLDRSSLKWPATTMVPDHP